ncbi:MAG: HAD family phosphatase [Thermoanaerobaculia bacterium]
MIRALLFDFNGILVDDEPLHAELLLRVLREEGVATLRVDAERFRGLDDRTALSGALRAAGEAAPSGRVARLVVRKAAYYRETIRRQGYPYFAGAVALVREAAAAGLPLALVSGALRDEVASGLEQAGIARFFKVVVTAEDVQRGKPDPQGYDQALTALNGNPPLPERLIHAHEGVAIEDSSAGLAAAAACGLRTLAVAPKGRLAKPPNAEACVETLNGLRLCDLEAILDRRENQLARREAKVLRSRIARVEK